MSNLNHTLHLRPATIDDLAVLRRWDDEPAVVESDPNDDWDWETELLRSPPWREQLIAEVDGRAIGFVQIIDPALEDSHYWGDAPVHLRAVDIWIGEADARGRGYGSEMMRQALARCFAPAEVEAVLIDPLASNFDAIRFYRRMGFEFVEARDFGDDHCHVHRLSRERYLQSLAPMSTVRPESETKQATVVLREAHRNDIPGMWTVRYAVTENTLTPGRISDEDVRREIEDTGKGWVIDVDGEIRAFASCNARTGNIWALFVHPQAEGLGYGDRLHAAMLDWLRTQPIPRLWLTTDAHSRACGFYARRGWQRVGISDSGEVRFERDNPQAVQTRSQTGSGSLREK